MTDAHDVLVPAALAFADLGLFLLRIWIGVVFLSSGWSHVSHPAERAESIGLSPTATAIVGAVELIGAALVVLGLWTQLGAAMLIAVMAGAIFKKVFVWKTGFWGEKSQGWYYDVLYLICCVVIITTGGGDIGVS